MARQTRPFFLAVLLMAVCGLISATAWADRLALVEVRAGEGLSPEIRKRFEAAAVKGLSSAGHSVISPDDVRSRLQGRGALAGCRGGDCVRPMTQALSVEGIVVGEVAAQEKNYVITLRLLRPTAAGASEVAKADERCDICTQAEADQAVEKAATNLGQQAAKLGPAAPPTPSSVVVTPPAPNGGPSAAPSAAPSSSAATQVSEERPRPWRTAALITGGAALVGLAVGIPLIVIDGKPTCSAPNPQRDCPEVRNTATAGYIFTGVGAASLVATGVFIYLDVRRPRNQAERPGLERFTVTPLPGGGYVGASYRFE